MDHIVTKTTPEWESILYSYATSATSVALLSLRHRFPIVTLSDVYYVCTIAVPISVSISVPMSVSMSVPIL